MKLETIGTMFLNLEIENIEEVQKAIDNVKTAIDELNNLGIDININNCKRPKQVGKVETIYEIDPGRTITEARKIAFRNGYEFLKFNDYIYRVFEEGLEKVGKFEKYF
ncbi:TPA: hypothetical protein U5097_002046 [Streptococcus agalactiae]|nr:hypothetical protein [Streptococcus agalactiae]HEN4681974.1 hypothetical protein [Streptococcus agalactiae]HEN4686071.1 hypothetical protein [Streptococcus agalactiae]HEO7689258.1 hypothetical protein [Streptococcus agalactiae]